MATKKPTTKSKSTKKSPSRLDKVIKKLNLARPRNQFVITFLVVGVIGGGWMAYQSFAATLITQATVANGLLYGFNAQNYVDSSKNKMTVKRVNRSGGNVWAYKLNIPKYKYVRACYIAKAEKPINAYFNAALTNGGSPNSYPRTPNKKIGTSYASSCSGWQYSGAYSYMYVDLQNNTNLEVPNAFMYVSQLYTEVQ